jgi:hypothetical protein
MRDIQFFHRRFYLPTALTLLLGLLVTILMFRGTTNIQLLVVGFHIAPTMAAITYTFPTSVLMAHEWPQGILPSTMVIFFDGTGCQFLSAGNIYIGMHRNSGHPHPSPSQYNAGQVMFGDMLNLMTTPTTRIRSIICRRITCFILPSVDN